MGPQQRNLSTTKRINTLEICLQQIFVPIHRGKYSVLNEVNDNVSTRPRQLKYVYLSYIIFICSVKYLFKLMCLFKYFVYFSRIMEWCPGHTLIPQTDQCLQDITFKIDH